MKAESLSTGFICNRYWADSKNGKTSQTASTIPKRVKLYTTTFAIPERHWIN
jgi:hypothetical protein